MASTEWPAAHSQALRELLASGLSYSRIAHALNARFGTCYSRNAAIGRAKRMGLVGPDRPAGLPKPPREQAPRLDRLRERRARLNAVFRIPQFEPDAPVQLRCVEIVPRHLALMDLGRNDCRYPYGGEREGEAITFCGHARLSGTSYCPAHFDLTRGPGTPSERAAVPIARRTVRVA